MASEKYWQGFLPYGLAALLIGLVGGFSTVLGPAFMADMGLPYGNTTWTALAQAMSTAAWAPVLGKLGDVVGRKRALVLGILVYGLGNVLTALAGSLSFMLLARFIVGIGTAAISPVILAYIVAEFPPEKTGKGFSTYMLISSASVIFGPTVGSWLIGTFGWRAMVWLCCLLCGLTLPPCLLLGEKPERTRQRAKNHFDSVGAGLVVVFFSLVLCLPAFGQNFGWGSRPFLLAALVGALSLIGLVLAEQQAENPILPSRFMKRSVFILSVAALFLTQGLMQANMTNTMVFVSYTQPGNTMVSGYAISVMYLGMSLGAVLLGPLADRFSPKGALVGSLLVTGLGCGSLLLFSENTPSWLLMASLGLLGLGLGGNSTIFLKTALDGLAPEEAGTGTGTYGLFRDLAAPFGVAVFVPLFNNQAESLQRLGAAPGQAAVGAMAFLALGEIICVCTAIALVCFLPHRAKRKEKNDDSEG